jgi:hypothetical protein
MGRAYSMNRSHDRRVGNFCSKKPGRGTTPEHREIREDIIKINSIKILVIIKS